MKLIKHIFILTLMIAFTFNATVGFAAGMCGDDHHDLQIMEVPCHDGEMAELEQVTPDDSKQDQKTAQCTMCKCGLCKSHSQMSLGHDTASPDVQSTQSTTSAHTDIVTSLIIYGIDNPPKQIS
jgi:hypothetical protein